MNKIALVFLLTILAGTFSTSATYAQSKKDKKKNSSDSKEIKRDVAPDASKAGVSSKGYIQMEAGMDYKIIVDEPGDVYPAYGDFLELHLNTTVDDSIIFDTRDAMGDGKPAPLQLQKSPFAGDLMVALQKFTAGDSAQVRILVDSLIAAGAPKAPWMKEGEGQRLVYNVKMITVTPKAEKQKQDMANAAKQVEIDDKAIQDYLASKQIKATKTETGLYYTVTKKGNGEKAEQGQKISVNYTGMLMDGTKFDSNVDPAFNHVQPFEFLLGTGGVIKGWDEGLALISKGGKATLFIPSTLAYGANSPSPKIPANSVLIFDVELVDIIAE